METIRLDRWLCAARIFRSRTQASQACAGGHVKLNGGSAKSHHPLRIGDELHVEKLHAIRILEVRALAERRLSAALARELYEDHSPPPPPPRERSPADRERGTGRPTKRDRRNLDRLRGR